MPGPGRWPGNCTAEGSSSGRTLSRRTGCRNARPDQATSAETSTTSGSTRVRRTVPLSLLNLSSNLSLISSGHGWSPRGGRRYRARSWPARADRAVERPTIRSRPRIGRPTTTVSGRAIGPMTAAHDHIDDVPDLDLQPDPPGPHRLVGRP